jgi:hypothetical protein
MGSADLFSKSATFRLGDSKLPQSYSTNSRHKLLSVADGYQVRPPDGGGQAPSICLSTTTWPR